MGGIGNGDEARGAQKDVGQRRRSLAARIAFRLGLAVLVAALLVLACAGTLALRPGLVRPLLVRAAGAAGVALAVGELHLGLSPLRLEARDVRLDTAPESTAGGKARVRLRLERLVAEADPAHWSDGPWLSSLELASLRLDALLPAAQPGGEATPWWRIPALAGRMSVTDCRARVAASWGVAAVAGLDVAVAPGAEPGGREFRAQGQISFDTAGDAALAGMALAGGTRLEASGTIASDGALRVALAVDEGVVDSSGATGRFEGQAEVALAGDVLDVAMFDLRVRDVDVPLPDGGRLAGFGAAVNASGRADLSDGTFAVRRCRLDAGERLRLFGSVSRDAPGGLRAELSGRIGDVALLLADCRACLPEALREVTCSGALGFEAALRAGGQAEPVNAGDAGAQEFHVTLAPEGLRLAWPRRGLDVVVSGAPGLVGVPGGEWTLGGTVGLAGDADLGPVAVRGVEIRAELDGTLAAPGLPSLHVSLPAGGVSMDGAALPLGRIQARAEVRREAGGELSVVGLDCTEERLGRFSGGVSLHPDGLSRSRGRVRNDRLELAALGGLLADLGVTGAALPALSGAAAVEARLEPGPGGSRAVFEVALADAGLATADGAWLADKGHGALRLEAGLGEARRATLTAALDGGELLLGTVYLDLGRTPLTLRAEADAVEPLAVSGLRAEAALGELAAVRLERGRARRGAQGWSWSAGLELLRANLPGLLEKFVKEPQAVARPELAGLLAGGGLALTLDAQGDAGAVDVEGRLALSGASLDYPPIGLAVSGLELDLPLAYRFGGPASQAKPAGADGGTGAPRGRLEVASVALPSGRTQGLAAAVELFANRLVLDGVLELPLWQGTLSVSRLRVDEPLSADFRAMLAASLEGVDLAALGSEQVPLEGSLAADFPVIVLTGRRLDAKGALTGTLYGGALRLDGVSVSDPLARSRVAGCDRVRLSGLDLERLSAALGIGRITGRLDMAMDGLRVAYGQPQALAVELRSVPTAGISQKVSLRAVNSISVVGTGSGLTGVGVGMFASFFKEFGYRDLGIRCTLENDVFSVRGLIREGAVEYLIRKPPLFGINVVNGNPDNRISFSDMVERVRRVLQSAPVAATGAPDDPGSPAREEP